MIRFLMVVLALLSLSSALAGRNVRKLSLRDLDGKKVRLSDYQGQIVVLNFWATWCGQIAQQYADRRVAFVLASIDELKKLPVVREFIAQQKVTLPVLVGPSADVLNELSGTYVVPATLIIDQDGEIVRAVNGETREEDVKEAVEWLLNGKTGPRPAERVKRY